MAQSRPRILVVDDVEDNVFTLERRLKQFLDPEITSAGNGVVALEKLRAAPFDLVLLDVQMPEMDGVAALEQMKSDMSLREVPVIMVSAVDDFNTVLRCIKLGADDYVQKPFNADLLRARVETALERKRLRDQETEEPGGEAIAPAGQGIPRQQGLSLECESLRRRAGLRPESSPAQDDRLTFSSCTGRAVSRSPRPSTASK